MKNIILHAVPCYLLLAILFNLNILYAQDTLSLPAVQNASMISDGKFLFIFGGLADNSISDNTLKKGLSPNSILLNDLSVGDPEQNKWAKEDPIGIKPEARNYQQMVYSFDNKWLYIYGGSINGIISQELWRYDADKKTWTKIEQAGTIPPGRIASSINQIKDGIIITGGKGQQGETVRDCWIFNFQSNAWTKKADIPADIEPGGHKGVSLNEYEILIWGGDNNSVLNEAWIFNSNSNAWRKNVTDGNGPQIKRGGFIMEKVDNKVYIGGGTENYTNKVNSFYSLDLQNWTWTKLPDMPQKLWGAASSVTNGKIYVYGGSNNLNERSNKLYEYDPAKNSWTGKNPVRVYPPKGPSNLTIGLNQQRAVLNWKDDSNSEDGFIVERKNLVDNSQSSVKINNPNTSTYSDETVEYGKEYSYRVGSFNFAGITYSEWKNILITDVGEELTMPVKFNLYQNYPNPFNPSTKIKYTIPESRYVIIKLFDTLGNEISVLLNDDKNAGEHVIELRADNLANGIYFYRMTAGKFSQVRKLILLK